MVPSTAHYSIKLPSFIYTQSNVKTVLFQAIQFSINTQFSSIWPIRCYHSGQEWTWERWQWRGTPHSPKLQHYWSLTIRLFSVMSRTLVMRGSYPSAEKQSLYSAAAAYWAMILFDIFCVNFILLLFCRKHWRLFLFIYFDEYIYIYIYSSK